MSRQTDRERLQEFATAMASEFPKDKFQRFMKKMYKNEFGGRPAPTVFSLMERDRFRDESESFDYEPYWKYYGFFDGSGMDDDEVREYLDEYVRVRICSPYDCTGQPFTRYIHWHRNPTGLISYINYMALDI